jgi:hypothetical protein
LLWCCCLATLCAQNNGNGKGKGKGSNAGSVSTPEVNVTFHTNEVQVIHQYYAGRPVNLPPGLQKKIARGKPLPPGWQKKLQPFPQDVVLQLNAPCGYCGRGAYDGYGVVYDKRTAVILDVVQLVADIVR